MKTSILLGCLSQVNSVFDWKVKWKNYSYHVFIKPSCIIILPVSNTLIRFNIFVVIDNLDTIQEEQTVHDDDEECRIFSGHGNLYH